MVDPNADYMHGESEEWALAAPLPLRVSPDGRRLEGVCPRCGHPIFKGIVPVDVVALRSGVVGSTEELPAKQTQHDYLVTCNCVYGHKDAPEDTRGCGSQAVVTVTANGAVAYTDPAPGPFERDADEWVERATYEQLSRSRQLAGQWASMLAVIASFVSFGVVVEATKADLGTNGASWIAYSALAGGAVIMFVVAIVLATQAAGLRQMAAVGGDLESRVNSREEAVRYCRSRIRWSVIVFLIASVALAAALWVRG